MPVMVPECHFLSILDGKLSFYTSRFSNSEFTKYFSEVISATTVKDKKVKIRERAKA